MLRDYGPSNFGAIVSDNGGGCEKGRNLVLNEFPHMLEHRCSARDPVCILCYTDCNIGQD